MLFFFCITSKPTFYFPSELNFQWEHWVSSSTMYIYTPITSVFYSDIISLKQLRNRMHRKTRITISDIMNYSVHFPTKIITTFLFRRGHDTTRNQYSRQTPASSGIPQTKTMLLRELTPPKSHENSLKMPKLHNSAATKQHDFRYHLTEAENTTRAIVASSRV